MKIKNFQELATTENRKQILQIAEAGLEAIDTEKVIQKNIQIKGEQLIIKDEKFSLKNVKRILVVGIGKCSLEAADALEKIMGEKISGGAVIDIHEGSLKRIKAYIGDHPFPTQRNIDNTKEIINLLSDTNENDLVIFIISGGGSTLLCQPKDLTCVDETQILKCLFESGADIQQINTIRKHISLARGGYLAKYAYPAQVISLIFSDVPGDDLEFIASGPTIKDTTTITDAMKIIADYNIENRCSLVKITLVETPKEDKYFKKVKNILLVSNKTALEAMGQKAGEFGFIPRICTTCLQGEAREVGVQIVKELEKENSKTALLYGGETTVTIKVKGKGGRNLELGLSALGVLKEGITVVPIASDGWDNTDFAGAICDKITIEKAQKLGLDPGKYLNENQSYSFFSQTGDYLSTGDTGSNVSDLIIAVKN